MEKIIKNKLEELEKTSDQFWNICSEVGSFINMLIKTGNYKNILEVGTSNGYSAIWIALALQQTGGHLATIEYYEERRSLAKNNLQECNLLDKATLIQGRANEVLETIDSSVFNIKNTGEPFVDFAFIDASKPEYLQYFNHINSKVKIGGMIVADNIISHEAKVQNYVDAVNANENYQSVKLNLGAGMLVSLKIK